jgi:hypothetical protein
MIGFFFVSVGAPRAVMASQTLKIIFGWSEPAPME